MLLGPRDLIAHVLPLQESVDPASLMLRVVADHPLAMRLVADHPIRRDQGGLGDAERQGSDQQNERHDERERPRRPAGQPAPLH